MARNLPREANRKTSSQAAEIFRKPVTWDDLYPEDKEAIPFEIQPEADTVKPDLELSDLGWVKILDLGQGLGQEGGR